MAELDFQDLREGSEFSDPEDRTMLIRSCLPEVRLKQRTRMSSLKFVLRGREVFRFQSRRFDVGPGEALLVPAGLMLDVELEKGRETTGLCLYDAGPESDVSARPEPQPLKITFDANFVAQAHEFERAVRLGRHDAPRVREFAALFRATGRQRLCRILALAPRTNKQRHERQIAIAQRLDRAHRYLMEHADRPMDLAELAETATMSKFEFCRAYRHAFGEPPLCAHRRARLNRAAELLRRTGLTATAVAEKLGFSEFANFSRAFRRQFDCPPGRYATAQSRT